MTWQTARMLAGSFLPVLMECNLDLQYWMHSSILFTKPVMCGSWAPYTALHASTRTTFVGLGVVLSMSHKSSSKELITTSRSGTLNLSPLSLGTQLRKTFSRSLGLAVFLILVTVSFFCFSAMMVLQLQPELQLAELEPITATKQIT